MTDAIVWKRASESELELLADRHSLDECKRDLAAILKLDPADEKKAFLLSFHVHNYSYPLHPHTQQSFSLRQTSVLLGMCQTLMERDFVATSSTDLVSSFAFFQQLLLAHSVERSPKSVGVFSPLEVAAIVDFVTHTYFRHFHLYKAVFTPFERVLLVQKPVNDVQAPRPARPLSEAILHFEPPPPAVETLTPDDAETAADASGAPLPSGL